MTGWNDDRPPVVTERLRRFAAFVREDVPESWEEIQARLEAEWPKLLADRGLQQVGPVTDSREEAASLRHIRRIAWTVTTNVPAYIAETVDPAMLNGYLTYEPEARWLK